jgi:hypothetical protein
MEPTAELRGREAVGRDGGSVGQVVEARADRLILEVPGVGRLELPHGELLGHAEGKVQLRHGQAWYRTLAEAPEAAELQDGRLHDVSVDAAPPLPDLQPGIELGDAPVHPTTATDPGLRASSIGPALSSTLPAPEEPPDVEAEGIAADDSDRILPGARGSHRAGVRRKD